MTARKAKAPTLTRRCGGIFTPDPDLPHPADHRGRRVCRCGLVGEPGDAHHRLPDVHEEQVQARRRAGEKEVE